jgi:predicted RNA-binding protein with TRAM domain
MASTVLIKAAGLQTSPNELGREDGALIEAKNVIIKRDNIIEPRRGFAVYGNQLPDTAETVKQLTSYRNRLILHYANKLRYDSDGTGTFRDFLGNYMETQSGLRMKFIEASGNLYFTTSDGVQKISARTANNFSDSGVITQAGAVKAVDFTALPIYTPNSQSGFLPQDSAVSYRVVWGYNDVNNNLVLGAPSQRVVASNPMIELLVRDYTRVLSVLDGFANSPLTSARINDKNYVATLGLDLNSSASDLYTNLIALTTKIDNDIFIADDAAAAPLQIGSASVTANILTITFSSGTATDYFQPGSLIRLGGTWTGSVDLSGPRTVVTVGASTVTINVTATDGAVTIGSGTIYSNEYRSITQPTSPSIPATNAQLVEMQEYISDIIDRLSDEPDAIISAADQVSIESLDITTTATVQIDITIPDGVDSRYFFQVYRSSIAQATGAGSFEDVVPSDELQLVYEAYPTPAELAVQEVSFIDSTPDDFRGANLYTNASTGEGILQANDIPPFAKDINRYRNSIFYANTRTLHRMPLNLLGVPRMIEDYDNGDTPKVTITNGETTNTYSFVVGQQEITEIETVADVAGSLNSTFFYIDSVDNKYYVWINVNNAGVDPAIPGRIGIEVKVATNATADQVASAVNNQLAVLLDQFISEVTGDTVTVTCYEVGETEDAIDITTGFTITNTQQGVGERVQPEITEIQAIAGSLFVNTGTSDYFTLNEPFDQRRYYFFFKRGTSTDPALSGRIGIPINIDGTETVSQVGDLIVAAIPSSRFTVLNNAGVVTITTIQYGETTDPTEVVSDAGFTISVTQDGALEVALSPQVSPAQAVDETARSFIRVINKNPGETIYASYLSSAFDVPGKMLLESRSLGNVNEFYVLGNNDNTGASFNPDIGPEGTVTGISAAAQTVITTGENHGLITGDQVVLTATDSIPSIDGLYTITFLTATSFSINRTVNTPGTVGAYIRAANAVFSENGCKYTAIFFT